MNRIGLIHWNPQNDLNFKTSFPNWLSKRPSLLLDADLDNPPDFYVFGEKDKVGVNPSLDEVCDVLNDWVVGRGSLGPPDIKKMDKDGKIATFDVRRVNDDIAFRIHTNNNICVDPVFQQHGAKQNK